MTPNPMSERVNQVQSQLFREFGTLVGPGVVEDTFSETLASYRDARIADFIPLFVQREARERLLNIAAAAR